MQKPRTGDLLIKTTGQSGEFLIVDAITHRVLRGPFARLSDAASAAAVHANHMGVAVWQENADNRGRPLAPVLLNLQGK